jgi:hypothetical protein
MADPSSESVKMFISRTAGVIEEVEEVFRTCSQQHEIGGGRCRVAQAVD